jgi:hypothetical protein
MQISEIMQIAEIMQFAEIMQMQNINKKYRMECYIFLVISYFLVSVIRVIEKHICII